MFSAFLLDILFLISFVCFVFIFGFHSQLKLSLLSYIFKELGCKECWKFGLCCFWVFLVFCFFFSEHVFFLCLSLFSFTLYCTFPSAVSLALVDSSSLQARHFRRSSREARMLWYFFPFPESSVPEFHLAEEPGLWEVGCQLLREVLGMP